MNQSIHRVRVDDLAKVRKFSGQTLGVAVSEQQGLLAMHPAGGSDIRMYPKPDHVPTAYAVVMFRVGDTEAGVGELTERCVQFARYDGMGQDERGITQGGGPFIAAWFEDPAGNVVEALRER